MGQFETFEEEFFAAKFGGQRQWSEIGVISNVRQGFLRRVPNRMFEHILEDVVLQHFTNAR